MRWRAPWFELRGRRNRDRAVAAMTSKKNTKTEVKITADTISKRQETNVSI
jgi:hypothetical protein